MLNKLKKHTTDKSKRVGRGYGSSKGGHTAGRGQKGQKSRSGYKPARRGFEGGAMPLSRRLPKLKGFRRAYFKSRANKVELSLTDLNDFKSGDTVSLESLQKMNLIPAKTSAKEIKILGNGTLDKKLTVKDIAVTASAKKQIEDKGGSVS